MAERYDDKIDAMRQAERTDTLCGWFGFWAMEYALQDIEQDKRNAERLETYRTWKAAYFEGRF